MSKDVQQNLLKFVSILGSKGVQREFVDSSTSMLHSQIRAPCSANKLNSSVSLSPTAKQKHRLSELSLPSNPKGIKRPSKMSGTEESPKKKLSPELQELKEEMRNDMRELISPLKQSIDLLLQIKDAWEEGLRECNSICQINCDLNARVINLEKDNKMLTDKVRKLEDKMLEGNIIFQGIPDAVWEPSETTKEKVLTAISHIISGTSHEDKMDQARCIPIKEVSRMGKFTAL